MAYVPGFRHDLFLSYAHLDDAVWLDGFQAALRQGLRERLGQEVSIWQDVHRLRLGQDWQDEIEEAVGGAALFVAVLSPGYFNSVWCGRERRHFLDRPAGAGAAAADGAQRFLKVIRAPSEDGAHDLLLPRIQRVAFFGAGDERTGDLLFAPGSDEFAGCMRETVHAIAALLRSMRRSREPVFVACPADDAVAEWQALRAELQAQSFDVRPEHLLDDGFDEGLVKREIDPAILTVFLLTGRHYPFLDRQLDFARELGKRAVFWLNPSSPPDELQAKLIEGIRGGELVPKGSTVLERMSSRDMIREVLAALKPHRAPAAAPTGGKPRVYLLYDPTTALDARVANDVRSSIQTEHLEVFVPEAGASTAADRVERHRQLLRDCEGVLLCRAEAPAPDQWLYQTVPEVLFAEQQLSRAPMLSKAFLLSAPGAVGALPNVIPLRDPVSSALLEPFLKPLRAAPPATAA